MAFYNEKEQLYLETDASGVGLGTSLCKGRWNVVPKEWSTQQCSTAVISICKQKPYKSKVWGPATAKYKEKH